MGQSLWAFALLHRVLPVSQNSHDLIWAKLVSIMTLVINSLCAEKEMSFADPSYFLFI